MWIWEPFTTLGRGYHRHCENGSILNRSQPLSSSFFKRSKGAGESSPGRKPWERRSSSLPPAAHFEGAREQIVCSLKPSPPLPQPFRPARLFFRSANPHPGLNPRALQAPVLQRRHCPKLALNERTISFEMSLVFCSLGYHLAPKGSFRTAFQLT